MLKPHCGRGLSFKISRLGRAQTWPVHQGTQVGIKWYKLHLMKPEGSHCPGRSVFSWCNTEAKVNSRFPRITRASAYPATGPPSRPISQEFFCRWERAAREDSYIINHAAGFNRCSTELQYKMSQNIALLCSYLNKGKAPKEVTVALNDLPDPMAFHQRVSVPMGTSPAYRRPLVCSHGQSDFDYTGLLPVFCQNRS